MKKLKYIILAGVLIAAIVGWYAYSEYNRKPTDLSTVKTETILNANVLFAAYTTAESATDSLYLGKIIAVKGKIIKIEKDNQGLNTVLLGTDVEGSFVSCQMDQSHNEEASVLNVGSEIVMKGECTGVLSDVVLTRCVVQK